MWKVVIFLGKMNGRFFCSKTLDERRKYFHIREENALKGGLVRLMWWSQNDLFWICIDSHFWHKLTLPTLKCSKKTSELRFLSLLEKMLALFWHSGRGNYYLEKRPMSEFFHTSTQSKFGERQRQKGENGKRNYLHSSQTFLQSLSFRKYRYILKTPDGVQSWFCVCYVGIYMITISMMICNINFRFWPNMTWCAWGDFGIVTWQGYLHHIEGYLHPIKPREWTD